MSVVLVHGDRVRPDIVEGASQTTIRRLLDTLDGAIRFELSLFELQPYGSAPTHQHAWEHEVFVLGGKLFVELPAEGRRLLLHSWDAIFIPPGERHGFTTEDKGARFLLVTPALRPLAGGGLLSMEPELQCEQESGEELR